MSTVANTTRALPPGGNARRVIAQADTSISTWLLDLVKGTGSSPAHIIITGILGVVPGVGQVMDARDLIVGVISIARTPMAIGLWVELVITLIGCVPAVGDALKVGFKLMKQGKNFGRVLEGVSPALRGNVEKFMRKIDWGMLSSECKNLFNKAVGAFIDGLDSWVVKAVAGGPQVKQIIAELKGVQKLGPKMIDDAFRELKEMHAKMMGHQLPGSTAAVAGVTGKGAREAAEEAAEAASRRAVEAERRQRKLLAAKSRDVKANRAAPNSTKTSTKKKAEPKKQKWRSGVPAEHITDYHVKKKHMNFRKANHNGKLTEEYSVPHIGLDHLWSNKTNPIKPYVVGETKSSIFDSFKLISALPADLQEKFAALRADEAANPTSNNGKPNIFDSEKRDAHANQRVAASDEEALKRGLNKPGKDKDGKPTGLATQMSHDWIFSRLADEELTSSGEQLKALLQRRRLNAIFNGGAYPYKRWVSLVTGRQLSKHQKSGGASHEVQVILDLPDNILRQ